MLIRVVGHALFNYHGPYYMCVCVCVAPVVTLLILEEARAVMPLLLVSRHECLRQELQSGSRREQTATVLLWTPDSIRDGIIMFDKGTSTDDADPRAFVFHLGL